MKLFINIILFTFSLSVWAIGDDVLVDKRNQVDSLINQLDAQGRKQGKWIYFGKDQPEKGYPLEGKISEGPFVNDRREGHWVMYYQDGKTPRIEGDYVNNRPNGDFVKYHPNGKVQEEGTFSQRSYNGTLKRYNEKGVLIFEGEIDEHGNEVGEVTFFYENGKKEFVYTANNGIPVGDATRYWPNGDVKERIVYTSNGSVQQTSGEIAMVNKAVVVETIKPENKKRAPIPTKDANFKPNGYNKIFNSNKEIWMEGEFKNGLLDDGRLYIYDEDGLLYNVEIYKNGHFHSNGQL